VRTKKNEKVLTLGQRTLTGTCYNFEMEKVFSSFLRRAGMPASAGLSCLYLTVNISRTVADTANVTINDWYGLSIGTKIDDLGWSWTAV